MSVVMDRDNLNHTNLNYIIVAHGLQKGVRLIAKAPYTLKKVDYRGVEYTQQLISYQLG